MEQGQADRVTRHPLLHALPSLILFFFSCGVDQSAGCSTEMFPMITFYDSGELTFPLLCSAFLGHYLFLYLFVHFQYNLFRCSNECIDCFSMVLCAFIGHSHTEKTTGKYNSKKHQAGFVVCVVCLSVFLSCSSSFSSFLLATLAFCNR